jgi:hypothetical protein
VRGTGASHRVKVQNPGSYVGMVRSLAGCFQGPQAERGGAQRGVAMDANQVA